MIRLRSIASIVVVTAALAGCSGSGGYGSDGGAQATAAASALAPIAAPSRSAGPAAGASTAAAGGGKYDYGTGGATASPAAAGSRAPGTVLLRGFAFEPAAISVAAGSEIAFTNRDSVKHVLVEGENGTPVSGTAPQSAVGPGQTVALPFNTAGTIQITCTIHPSMRLTVTVNP